MLVQSARLVLPPQPLHVPHWRQTSCLYPSCEPAPCPASGTAPAAHCVAKPPVPVALPTSTCPCRMSFPKLAFIDTARWLVRAVLSTLRPAGDYKRRRGVPSIEGPPPSWLLALPDETPLELTDWLAAYALSRSRNLHLLTMATGVLLSFLIAKTELVAREVYGAGKTQCVALLAAYFALPSRIVDVMASREHYHHCDGILCAPTPPNTTRRSPSALPRGHSLGALMVPRCAPGAISAPPSAPCPGRRLC